MPQINFFTEDVSFTLKGKKIAREWLISSLQKESKTCGDLNYIFCSDEYLKKVNIDFLQHDYYTDIITFDYSEADEVSGDIYVSIDRIKDNAKQFDKPVYNELSRVLIHGVLHLTGYKDKSDADQKQMTEKEDFYLSLHPLL